MQIVQKSQQKQVALAQYFQLQEFWAVIVYRRMSYICLIGLDQSIVVISTLFKTLKTKRDTGGNSEKVLRDRGGGMQNEHIPTFSAYPTLP